MSSKPTTPALDGLADVRAEVRRRERLPHEIEHERTRLAGELLLARQRRHDAQTAAKGQLPAAEGEKLRKAVVDLERQVADDSSERAHAARIVAAEAPALEREFIDANLSELVAEMRVQGDRARDRLRAAIDELIDADLHYNRIAHAWGPILEAVQRRDGPVAYETARGALGTRPIAVVDPGHNRRRYLNREWGRLREVLAVLGGIFPDGMPTPTPAALNVPPASNATDTPVAA